MIMNKLVKPVFILLFMFAFGFTGYGQRAVRMFQVRPAPNLNRMNRMQNGQGRKIELLKENFIGRRLNLTPDEAKAFWPLYRRYVQDLTAVRIMKRQNSTDPSTTGTDQINKELAYDTELVNIRKHYLEEFLKILPPEKVSELYKSEREFTDEMLKQLSERTVKTGD